MVVMGIDASTTSTGWSIFEGKQLIAYGAIKPKGENWRDRLIQEGPELKKIVQIYKPQKVYMEDVPLKPGNIKTLMILGAVQGFIYGLFSSFEIPVFFLNPSEWRKSVGLFDGTNKGKQREELKKKAIEKVNKEFDLKLIWKSASSKFNEDDQAEAILICYSQVKAKKFSFKIEE